MSFSENERTLQVIQSEINKINKNMMKKINKKELDSNTFLQEVNENIIDYQKKLLEEKVLQLKHIEKLYDYLEKHFGENKQGVVFQQKKLERFRLKLEEDIEKYLHNI